ncbi:hypothetical protein [Phenylobacterium sp.]|uniref:hypothetical protein n=1 Tax=Phenylobacterium sp. TaxID=1871053 RepID=UPI0025E5F30D|nr:hypothetical protein [Phenylobacterium sp.]
MDVLSHVLRDARLSYLARSSFALRVTDYTSREIFQSRGLLLSWVGRERLAAELGAKPDSIRLADKLLCECGYMALESAGGGFGQTNRYLISIHAEPAERKTPPRRGVMNPPDRGREHLATTPRTAGQHAPLEWVAKPPVDGGVKPLTQTSDDETRFASGGEDGSNEVSFRRVLRAIPQIPRGRSNNDLLRSAFVQLVAEGVEHRTLAIAVEEFCRQSPDATEDGGRHMGKAHEWLLRRRWEAYEPTPEGVFFDGLSEVERRWLADVRLWQRRPGEWQRTWGPRPDQPGCQAPVKILQFCGLASPLAEAS